jgi:hypothetical protein
MHYGGPNGYRLDCTLEYWEKVRRELESSFSSKIYGKRSAENRRKKKEAEQK